MHSGCCYDDIGILDSNITSWLQLWYSLYVFFDTIVERFVLLLLLIIIRVTVLNVSTITRDTLYFNIMESPHPYQRFNAGVKKCDEIIYVRSDDKLRRFELKSAPLTAASLCFAAEVRNPYKSMDNFRWTIKKLFASCLDF